MPDYVSVEDFGAVGDGVTDDTVAIRKAVETGNNVYFPTGKYLVTEQITVSSSGQTLFSIGGNQETSANTTADILVEKDLNTPLFLVTAHMVAFKGLVMKGPGKESKTTAIMYEKRVNKDDVDGKIIGCLIKSFGLGVNC